jgi:polar amino acid transport system substrate-binding protein
MPGLLTDKFDMIGSGMTVTQERNLRLNFSEPSSWSARPCCSSLAGKVSSIEDLNDASYRIATTEGTTGEAAAQRFLGAARLSRFATPEEAVHHVVNGADAFITTRHNLIASSRAENRALLVLEQPFTFEPLAFG